ncbi:MAG: division/cell wall cluster transcriptional repressor MraZ [Candidatus Hydrogenedentes bacterium]|nr:division/cell wall cluster transcriptional repressor MraZ [Candidatus Hydrogenedentota bacterium]
MYYGETQTALDDKGRLNVPIHFRKVMEDNDHETWFLTRGFDGAIFLFNLQKWQSLVDSGQEFSPLDPRMLDFRRLFLGSVAKVKRDKAGRLAIPSYLREYAGIDRDAVLLGVEDHLELWSKTNWVAFQQQQMAQYKAMAGDLFRSGKVGNEGDARDAKH